MTRRRPGLTLVEVLAAIGLLAALLAAVVTASSRHARQLRRAQDRLAAQEIADELLTDWLVMSEGQIEAAWGEVPDRPGWQWRLSGRLEPGLEPFGLHVGILQVLRPALAGEAPEPMVLATVEFASSSPLTAEAATRAP